MKKRVIVAGHACLDLTPLFPAGTAANQIGELLVPGTLVNMQGIHIHTGGAVSNTGLAMKRLGVDVRLMAKVGADAFGGLIRDIYDADGAADGLIVVPGERTSYSAVLAVPGLDRIFLHDPGCNDTFSLADIPPEALDGAALFHFGYPPIMRRMYENGGAELEALLRFVKRKGVPTSLDLAFVDESSPAGQADWAAILSRALPWVDFFVPSIEELCWMLDRPRYRQWQQRAGGAELVNVLDPEADIAPLAKKCIELGAKVVLLKCGAPGLYYRTASRQALEPLGLASWADQAGFQPSFVPEQVRSATGAGDTTIAAFLTAMLRGYPLVTCVQLAAAEGACCVESYDALGGIRPLEALEEKIQGGWKTNHQETKSC